MATPISSRWAHLDPTATLHLLGRLRLESDDSCVELAEGNGRLLALLALHSRPVDRRWASATLWPEASDQRAAGNLRSCLWRLRASGRDVVRTSHGCLSLADRVEVDIHHVDSWAGRVVGGTAHDEDLSIHPDTLEALDLLPSWYDDWVLMARERLRQRVLHALESLSATLSERGEHEGAVEAAVMACSLDPFRDSAQRALIAAHLAEGNWIESQRSCRVYVDRLLNELGIAPAADLMMLLERPWEFQGRRTRSGVPPCRGGSATSASEVDIGLGAAARQRSGGASTPVSASPVFGRPFPSARSLQAR